MTEKTPRQVFEAQVKAHAEEQKAKTEPKTAPAQIAEEPVTVKPPRRPRTAKKS